MDGVRGGQLRFGDHVGRLDHLVQLRRTRVPGIDDVDSARGDAGDDEVAAVAAPFTAGAGVPAEVVQLIADLGHPHAMDHLRIGLRLRIDIDGREIIRLLGLGAGIGGDDVGQLLRRRIDGIGGRGEDALVVLVLGGQKSAAAEEREEGQSQRGGASDLRWRENAFDQFDIH